MLLRSDEVVERLCGGVRSEGVPGCWFLGFFHWFLGNVSDHETYEDVVNGKVYPCSFRNCLLVYLGLASLGGGVIAIPKHVAETSFSKCKSGFQVPKSAL